ncbi:coiled-coil domain-containing protein 50 isoform X3 [Triplophysa rosa]|uniref:Coiled-coil domain-containing protein 50 n=1 Tax=Triplophysa rosa TaxID=992332 RepID=A0A9W7WAW7_TRIRA|nr:coiled-coil domain-containing protein 50 isoform X3 [Triplophysa rosa]KAI7791373.1 putative coiled-coil domain-containing protein 50 [Triplophysa rosa]
MADFSIDQKNLPGVKEVCRDFAVLEDHCLAHNLQEQEIESHLASNVHKSRLVQQDLQVAKRLQEEEDQRAKAVSKRQQRHIERIDNEMAQEIQEQLVWQAEQQRKQEEKDEAIARKLQEREMKEERKRHKQLDSNFEEEYYEDQGRRVRGEYGMREATHGLAHLDLQDQESKDLEVARMLQEEEIKASQIDKRDSQVSQDEELARRLMEEEKREYKKSRDKEKRRAEVPVQEEVVRPRTRDEVYNSEEEYQRARNHKPARPPPPTQQYENINPSYAYAESPYSPRPPSRPEAAYKGAYYRQ